MEPRGIDFLNICVRLYIWMLDRKQTMGEEEASYLLERIERAGNAYTPFTAHCYGVEEAAVPLG